MATINPLHRVAAMTVAVYLNARGLETDWVARVVAADDVTEKRLQAMPDISPEEQGVQRIALRNAWQQLYTEAYAKLDQYPIG